MNHRPYPVRRREWHGYLWFTDLIFAGGIIAAVAISVEGIRWLLAR